MIRPQSYVDSKALSNSDLKLFEDSLRNFHLQKILNQYPEEKPKVHFDIGDLVDIRLLQPHYLNRYAVFTDVSANETMRNMLNVLLKKVKLNIANKAQVEVNDDLIPKNVTKVNSSLDVYQYLFEELQKECCYYYNAETKKFSRLPATVSADILGNGTRYWQELVHNDGKTMVSMDTWQRSINCLDRLIESQDLCISGTNHKIVEHIKESKIYEVLKGFEKFATINSQKVKMLGDLVFINHQMKLIYPFDLKTTDQMGNFTSSYKSYKYYRQGAFYSEILKRNYPGYRIAPFTFIVVATQTDEKPELFEMSPNDLSVGLNGITFGSSGYSIKGVTELLEDINWHIEQNVWDHRRSFYNNGRKHILECFGTPKYSGSKPVAHSFLD